VTLYAFPSPNISVDAALQLAGQADLTDVVVLGWKPDGEFYWGGSNGALKEIQWLLTHAQAQVQRILNDE